MFQHLKSIAYKLAQTLRNRPAFIGIEVSRGCNRGCYYCPQSVTPSERRVMSGKVWEQVINRLTEYRWRHGVHLNLYNELGLVKDSDAFVRDLRAVGCKPFIFSNGDYLAQMESWLDAGAYHILVTEHPPFNENWAERMAQFKARHGNRVTVRRIPKLNSQAGRVPALADIPPITRCVEPVDGIVVGIDGHYGLCCLDWEVIEGRKMQMASVFTVPFEEHWKRTKKPLVKIVAGGTPVSDLCMKCFGL